MAKYVFTSTIGTYYANTKADARDEFIQWGFTHQLDMQKRYEGKVVRSVMLDGQHNTIIFTVDGVEYERWQLRATWGIMDKIRKLMRMK